ncbi:MAG: MGMT family protein, partial [Planctomycetaceae bacterium]|nr:MGMT family protein [Planctomycetaceae bacterium]
VRGTVFQVNVWRALLEIPTGQLVTYRQVAQLAEHPQAVRAVGTAVGRNPIGYLIPCHRVIRSTGVIGGYRWGTTRKRLLIATELSQSGG